VKIEAREGQQRGVVTKEFVNRVLDRPNQAVVFGKALRLGNGWSSVKNIRTLGRS
jgi:hypothetical protein